MPQFARLIHRTKCTKCEPGLFSVNGASADAKGNAICTKCEPGLFQPEWNATNCNICAAGATGVWQCSFIACRVVFVQAVVWAGFFSQSNGSKQCTSCDDKGDYYQELTGQSSCSACPKNSRRYAGKGKGSEKTSCKCQQG